MFGRLERLMIATLLVKLSPPPTPSIWRVSGEPIAASKLNPRLTAATDRVLAKTLSKSPDARYATCTQFIAELERALLASGPRAAVGASTPVPATA